MRVAVVGTGISGMLSAWLLSREHEVTVFESAAYAGGHTRTVRVLQDGIRYDVDTGFIVYNERTYPNFVRLLAILGVESQPTTMSFSVRCDRSGFEYGTASVRALFAQRSNLVQPAFYRMLRDVLRFNREAPQVLDQSGDRPDEGAHRPNQTVEDQPLGSYLVGAGYSAQFIERYIVPMAAAIWSTDPTRILEFPASQFVRFFHNHGLLSLVDQPRWRVIRGGSSRYVEPLTKPYRDRIRLETPVRSVRRTPRYVEITPRGGAPERFDHVVVACHSDQALRMLVDPTGAEREILGAIRYQSNEVTLHTDSRVLPRNPEAWSAWNYRIPSTPGPVAVTYDMNLLQGLRSSKPFCVTLNSTDIDPDCVVERTTVQHPLMTAETIAAQARYGEINGPNRTSYAGAYWGFGFHEDGVNSALAAVRRFGVGLGGSVVRLDDYQRTGTRGRLAS